jgi:hypothetical protein
VGDPLPLGICQIFAVRVFSHARRITPTQLDSNTTFWTSYYALRFGDSRAFGW